MNKLLRTIFLVGVTTAVGAPSAWAGPVVIDGTDANDHGSFNSTTNSNVGGWLYMEKVLNNLAPQVGNGNKTVVSLGTSAGTQAGNAINSAFSNSILTSSGWTKVDIKGATQIGNFLSGQTVNGISLAQTGILYLSTNNNSSGDLSDAELGAINSNATAIANFVGGAGTPNLGGGLFTQGESPTTPGITSYQWLKTLIPGININDGGSGGFNNPALTLTSAGSTAFPGLTNADLSTGPWHNYFGGSFGGLQVLFTGINNSGQVVPQGLGGGAGTTIIPPVGTGVPEPSANWGLLAFVGLAVRFLWKRPQQQQTQAEN